MQDLSDEKDAEALTKVNENIANPNVEALAKVNEYIANPNAAFSIVAPAADRQAGRQTDRQTGKIDRQTGRQTDRLTGRERQSDRQTDENIVNLNAASYIGLRRAAQRGPRPRAPQ